MVMKKNRTLRIIFFEYLIAMVLSILLAFLIPIGLFILGISNKWYTYANASEVQAKNAVAKIRGAENFDSSLIPSSVSYAFLNRDNTVRETNMDQKELREAISYDSGDYKTDSLSDCYLSISRNDGTCILHYYVRSHYQLPWMDRYLPPLDLIIIGLIIFNSLLVCLLVTTLFASRLKRKLEPIRSATHNIKERNLDFDTQTSEIKEFNDILVSISDMKTELKNAMEQQWKMEQAKKEQTSALAHDIKTPLTIIRGNTELLSETSLTGEQREYTDYILNNANKMEQYLRLLISLTKEENDYNMNRCIVNTAQFIADLQNQANGLAAVKQIEVDFVQKDLPLEFTADPFLLHRAIINVVSNAIDYTSEGKKVSIFVEKINANLRFQVIDNGKGFTAADMKQATTQFYMGDASRNKKMHYGIGLYITKNIIEQHKGTIFLENSDLTRGGKVSIEIPVNGC